MTAAVLYSLVLTSLGELLTLDKGGRYTFLSISKEKLVALWISKLVYLCQTPEYVNISASASHMSYVLVTLALSLSIIVNTLTTGMIGHTV